MAIANIKAALGVFVALPIALGVVRLSTASAHWAGAIASNWPWATVGLVAGMLVDTAAHGATWQS